MPGHKLLPVPAAKSPNPNRIDFRFRNESRSTAAPIVASNSASSSPDRLSIKPSTAIGPVNCCDYLEEHQSLMSPMNLAASGGVKMSKGDKQSFSRGSSSSLPASYRRRVSLPVESAILPTKTQTILNEALGMVNELLSQRDLPAVVITGLRSLLNLLNNAYDQQTRMPMATRSTCDLAGQASPSLTQTHSIGDQLSILNSNILARRSSPVTWSTVTSASGMPTLEPEPTRPRSSSFWREKLIDEEEPDPDQHDSLSKKQSADLLIQTSDGTIFDQEEIENDQSYADLKQWALPIFNLHAKAPNTLLSKIAYLTFSKSNLFNIFRISKQKFFNFFHALEQGYWKIPYHNIIHASDVLHAVFYFVNNPIPALDFLPAGLATELSGMEIMALYTASAAHDFDHPGLTNAFLVATGDPKAILYNDRSVLENHHAASTWRLLCKSQNYFIEHLDAAEYKRFRYIVMEAILATDLKRHFEMLVEFNEQISNRGIDWKCEGDRLLVMQMCIKAADINSPTKPYDLHIGWTDRIVEEFYTQGDSERSLGIPVSAFMDRHEPQVAKLQDSFITHLVKPLVLALQSAGLLCLNSLNASKDARSALLPTGAFVNDPSTSSDAATVETPVPTDPSSKLSSHVRSESLISISLSPSPPPPLPYHRSELLHNVEENLARWKAELSRRRASADSGDGSLDVNANDNNLTLSSATTDAVSIIVEPAIRFNVNSAGESTAMMGIIEEHEENV